jgi:hypothetical protein
MFKYFVGGSLLVNTIRSEPHDGYCIHPGDTSWIDCINNGQYSGKQGYFYLPEGTYFLDRHFQLPDNVYIEGAGPGKTTIQATKAVYNGCGEHAEVPGDPKTRIGFVLSTNSYIGQFKYVALDDHRWQGYDGAALCGGAVFETPGCSDAYCKSSNIGDRRYGNGGVHDVTIDNVVIRGLSNNLGPQVGVFLTQTRDLSKPSYSITIRGIDLYHSWADGINIHGATHSVRVEDCKLAFQGDDNLAVWSHNDMATDIVFSRNHVSQKQSTNPDKSWGNCVALYGGSRIQVLDTNCEHTSNGGVKFANSFGGGFARGTDVLVQNMQTDSGKPNCAGQETTQGLINRCPKPDKSGCSDPCFIHRACKKGAGYKSGNMGDGWYCSDQHDVDALTSFDNCCIHPGCAKGATYNTRESMWMCKDDMSFEETITHV